MQEQKNGLPSDLNIEETAEETEDSSPKTVVDYTTHEYAELLRQVQSERQTAYNFMYPKFVEWNKRLKILNNQVRAKDKVGNTLMFTVHQTLLAAFYQDKITVKFVPREDGDQEEAECWNLYARYSYDEMQKSELDYDWIWDTLMFSYSLALVWDWDTETSSPIPVTIDTTTFMRDPDAVSVRGKRNGEGKMRFGGNYVYLTEYEIEQYIKDGVFDGISSCEELEKETMDTTIIEENQRLRKQNLGYQATNVSNTVVGANKLYAFIRWFTFNEKGCPLIVWGAGQNFTKIIGVKELRDSRKRPMKWFPLALRKIHPVPGQWDGVSVSDLCEDKQRALSILDNVMLDLAKFAIYSRYVYDSSRIKNRADLDEFVLNQFIAVDGNTNGVVQEIPKSHIPADLSFVVETLTNESQRATATPEIQQGVQSATNRTATENAQVAQNVATRYGLNAKVFAISERHFWELWREVIKKNFTQGKKKVIRLNGNVNMTFREITKDNLDMSTDADVIIESLAMNDAERAAKLSVYSNLYSITAQDPTVNKRAIIDKIGQYSELTEEERKDLFPLTFDEILAERENQELNDNKIVDIHPTDDDYTHMRIHRAANMTNATKKHLEAHAQNLFVKKMNPQQQQQSASPIAPEQVQQTANAPVPQADYSTPKTLQTA